MILDDGVRIKLNLVRRALARVEAAVRSNWLEASIEAATRARAAEPLDVGIRIRATRTLTILGVQSVLRGREVAGASSQEQVFYEAVQSLTTRTVVVEEGDEQTFHVRIVVPVNAPSTFGASRHHVVWIVGATIAVDYCPDWAMERVVEVYPGQLRAGTTG